MIFSTDRVSRVMVVATRTYVGMGEMCEDVDVATVSASVAGGGGGAAVRLVGARAAASMSMPRESACASADDADVDGAFEVRFVAVGVMDADVEVRVVRSDGWRYAREVHLGYAARFVDSIGNETADSARGTMRAARRQRSDAFDRTLLYEGGVGANWTESVIFLVDVDDVAERMREVVFRELVVASIDDETFFAASGVINSTGVRVNETDALAKAEAAAYARAYATLSEALSASPSSDAEIPRTASFAVVWSIIGAVGASLIALGWLLYIRRRRQRANKDHDESNEASFVDSLKNFKMAERTMEPPTGKTTGISPVKTTVRRRQTPTTPMDEFRPHRFTTMPPIFPHTTAFARNAVSRIDSLAALHREYTLNPTMPSIEDSKEDHLALDVNRTQDSEEFHQHALDVDSPEAGDHSDAFASAVDEEDLDEDVELSVHDLAREVMKVTCPTSDREGDDDAFKLISPGEFDRYVQVYERLGSGGHSTVYAAKWFSRQVALKMIHDDGNSTTMQSEIRIMRGISHPNIVKIYGACFSPACLVLQIVHGGSLHEVLHCGPQGVGISISEPNALAIGRDIASAMTYLHELEPKIIHRDLKPQNVLIEQQTHRAFLADFGVSRAVNTSLNSYGAGTVNYMAPELFSDSRADEKVDVYSFAMILYETLTGIQPWKGIHPVRIAALLLENEVATSRPALPTNISAFASELIRNCWQFDSSSRPSFREIQAAIERRA